MQRIPPDDIVPFDLFDPVPIRLDLVYGQARHPENHFGQVYHPAARLSGHFDLVCLALLAAHRLYTERKWTLVVKDCLRTVEAQQRMIESPAVKANPHWLEGSRFVTTPGRGAHPRGMALDLAVDGVDMGTKFDHMGEEAHRNYDGLTAEVKNNRVALEAAVLKAAADLSLDIRPLAHEWWDFRFPIDYFNGFEPLSDADLPGPLRMTAPGDGVLDEEMRVERVWKRLRPLWT